MEKYVAQLKYSYYRIYFLFHYDAYGKLALVVTPVTVTPVTKQALSGSQTLANTLITHSKYDFNRVMYIDQSCRDLTLYHFKM